MHGSRTLITVGVGLLALLFLSVGAGAQSSAPTPAPPNQAPVINVADQDSGAEESATEFAKKLQNPIGDLYSFPFQSNTNLNHGPHRGT
jgi:hypothetical protein